MATYVETHIMEALFARLASLTLSPTMPIAWPGTDLRPPSGGYLRASHLPNTTAQITLGTSGLNRHVGLFQIDVMWPESEGLTEPLERAGAVIAHFARGTTMTRGGVTVRVTSPPSLAPAQHDPPFMMVPVSIPYFADTANPS